MFPQHSPNIYENLFHAASVNLVVPETSSFDPSPSDDDLSTWWSTLREESARDSAYFDEKLVYFVAMSLPDESLTGLPGTPVSDAKEPTSELLRFIGRLQLTMTASFVPRLPAMRSNKPPAPSKSSGPPSSSTLAPPTPSHLQSISRSKLSDTDVNSHKPPITPNPFPAMSSTDEQYANVEGVAVWEGAVEEQPGPWEDKKEAEKQAKEGHGWGRRVFKTEGGWEIVWRGEVPIAYVRTTVENPVLALTTSVTLREHASSRTHRKGLSMDGMSIRSGTETIRTDGTDDYDYDFQDDDEDWARMEEIDLLNGLAGEEDIMPATRLPLSLRRDISVAAGPLPSPMPMSAITPATADSITTASTSSFGIHRERGHHSVTTDPILSTTLRKSFRRILTLAPGLRVRMRTLFMPQLLPLTPTSSGVESEEGERRVVLLVEVENNPEPSLSHGFEITQVNVEVGGKGSRTSTKLVCQPENMAGRAIFPVRLGSIEQYNLLYTVEISGERSDDAVEEAVARGLGRGDETRPVAITVIGRPYRSLSAPDTTKDDVGGYAYPTQMFHSRWNCTLDLQPFYATQPPLSYLGQPSNAHAHDRPSLPPPGPPGSKHRRPPALSIPSNVNNNNAIVGDKRYSLATLLSSQEGRERGGKEKEEGGQGQRRAIMPSLAMHGKRGLVGRVGSVNHGPSDHGLLLSIKILPQTTSSSSTPVSSPHDPSARKHQTIKPLVPFFIEVFIRNMTDQVRRFRLSIPGRENDGRWEARVRDVVERRERGGGIGSVLDSAVLKTTLSAQFAATPALIPLEDDVRCGPLLPGASLSARIRFLALRNGVHTIDRLRVIGVGDELDWTMCPVIDVIVGDGVDLI